MTIVAAGGPILWVDCGRPVTRQAARRAGSAAPKVIICCRWLIRLTAIRLPPYSGGIDQLAELTQALRRENAALRLAHAAVCAENAVYVEKMAEAQQRVQALLEQIPDLVQASLAEAAAEQKEAS